MQLDPLWLEAFKQVFSRCRISDTESVIVLTEAGSRADLIQLAEITLA